MYQSKQQINDAFIAAIHSLEKIPIFWKLKEVRLQNLYSKMPQSKCHKKCTCEDDYDKLIMFPYFFPLFPSEGQSYQGEYSVLPFFYLVVMNNSKAFPIVELVEIPLLNKELSLFKLGKDKIDSILTGIGISYITCYKKVTKNNMSEEIMNIRRRVLKKIFGLTKKESTIFFSVFSDLPKDILLADQTGYLRASAMNQQNISWSFQSKRIVPVKYHNNLFLFSLSCFALSKNEV